MIQFLSADGINDKKSNDKCNYVEPHFFILEHFLYVCADLGKHCLTSGRLRCRTYFLKIFHHIIYNSSTSHRYKTYRCIDQRTCNRYHKRYLKCKCNRCQKHNKCHLRCQSDIKYIHDQKDQCRHCEYTYGRCQCMCKQQYRCKYHQNRRRQESSNHSQPQRDHR